MNSLTKCTGRWMIENPDEVWSYRFFWPDDPAGRLFEVDKHKKVVNVYNAIYKIYFVKSLTFQEFKDEFGEKTFLNLLYYELHFKNLD